MFLYVLKRIFLFVPTFFIISALIFILSRVVPGDPVAKKLSSHSAEGFESAEMGVSAEAYRLKAAEMGFDKPIFYFSLSTSAYPDTLYRIYPARQRAMVHSLTRYIGNWPKVEAYYHELQAFQDKLGSAVKPSRLPAEAKTAWRGLVAETSRLLTTNEPQDIGSRLEALASTAEMPELQGLAAPLKALRQKYEAMLAGRKAWAHLIPSIHWYGSENQYHHWISGFLNFEFGVSYEKGYPVEELIWDRFYWTFIMNIVSLFLVFGLAIPLGVYSAVWRQERERHFTVLAWLPSERLGLVGGLRFALMQVLRLVLLLFFVLTGVGIFWLLWWPLKLGLVALAGGYLLQFYLLPRFLPKGSRTRRLIGRWAWLGILLLLMGLAAWMAFTIIGLAWGSWLGQGSKRPSTRSWGLSKGRLYWKGKGLDKFFTMLVFLLYSLPAFWVGTLLMVYLTSSSGLVDWFPTLGTSSVDMPADASWWMQFWDVAAHLTLPIFCITYGALAIISRQMRRGMLDVIQADYILTARAKGLPKQKVIWRHTFRNALMPILALSAGILPGMLAGSVAIEYIFRIPGMGMFVLEAIRGSDWPIVLTVLMLAAFLTILGSLLADILTKWLNPRVNFK